MNASISRPQWRWWWWWLLLFTVEGHLFLLLLLLFLYSSSYSFFNAPPTINERWTLLNLSRMMTNYRRLVLIQGYLSRFFYFALINNDNIQVLNIFSDNQTERKIGFIRRNEIETTSFHSIVETSEKYRILQEIQGSVFYRGTISCLCVFLVE